jgi:glycosyltransferase involved in cell wall biosynthesis
MLRRAPESVLLAAGRTGGEEGVRRALGGDDAGGRIRCIGPARQAELADLYAAADLFVLPTLLWEVLPYVLLEAMASGLPVVATRLGGNVELVGDAGVLVPRKDAAALAGAMTSLAGDPDGRAQLGAAARARVLRLFGQAVAARRILGLLEDRP